MRDESLEQQARDLLERLGHPHAQSLSSGDMTELANLMQSQHQCCALAGSVETLLQKESGYLIAIENLKQAIRVYGQHQGICSNFPERTVCTCGLNAALAQEGAR